MKRDGHTLHRRLEALIAKPISPADRLGRLYIFADSINEFKVGRSGNVKRRQTQWNHSCPNASRRWYGSVPCLHSHRAGNYRLTLFLKYSPAVESIAHLLLELHAIDRPRLLCPSCALPFPIAIRRLTFCRWSPPPRKVPLPRRSSKKSGTHSMHTASG